MKIDIFSDTVCPWCRIGKQNLFEALSRWKSDEPVTVRWRSFQLDPTVPVEGKPFKETFRQKFGGDERMSQMFGHVCKVGEACGLPFDFDKIQMSPNTLLSHQLIQIAPEEKQTQIVEAIMKAYFEDGRNIGDLDVLVSIADENGIDGANTRKRLMAQEGLEQVKEDLEFAAQAQISGVPFFILNDRYALSGAQPPEAFLQAFEQIKAKA